MRFFPLQKTFRPFAFLAALAGLAAGIVIDVSGAGSTRQSALKDVFKKDFLIGAALNQNQFTERDTRALPIIINQFNSITPENVLKWGSVHPQPNTYNFD